MGLELKTNDLDRRGAVVLCGGESRRMGRAKAWLPFGPEALLTRVVRRLGEAVPPRRIVVVAAGAQALPPLPAETIVVRDRLEGQGPLPAIVEGLAALPAEVEAALVTGCDAPLLGVEFIRCVFEQLAACDVAAPVDERRLYPLAAAYRRAALPRLRAILAAGETSLHRALRAGAISLNEIPLKQLRAVDPELRSLVNCNSPDEYAAALRLAGLGD